MEQNNYRYPVCRQMLAVIAAGIAVLSLPASAADPASASEFDEVVYSFDGKPGKNNLPEPWRQNTSKTFHPLGKVEIIDAKFEQYKKAVRITNTSAKTDMIADKVFPAKAGDVFKVSVAFRSLDGKTPVYFGIYPMRFGPGSEYQNMRLKPVGKGWDSRYGYFEIKKPQTKAVSFFISGLKNSVTDFSYLSIRKLRADEIPIYLPSRNLKLWKERTVGTNLARGKKVIFFPVPNHPITSKGGTDARDLTDGIVHQGSGMLHFQSEAVGWDKLFGTSVSIVIDLGEVKPVGKGVIRITGGRLDHAFPKNLTIWGSRDGVNFYRGQSLTKLNKLEEYLSNFKDVYYLPEAEDSRGSTWEYPFELELNADVRYVAFQIQPGRYRIFCDEAAVIQADPRTAGSPDFNRIYKQVPKSIVHESVILRPKMDAMYIAEGKWFPNFLTLDCRKKDQGERFTFSIDLPSAVEFRFAKSWPYDIRTYEGKENRDRRVIYKFKSAQSLKDTVKYANDWGFGPFYFMVGDSSRVPADERYAVFRTFCNGKLEKTVKLPLEILKMPVVPHLKRLANSMSMNMRYVVSWPDFLSNIKSAGFNVLPVKPDYPAEVPLLEKYLKEALRSPNRYCMYSYIIEQRKKAEFYCPVPGSGIKTVCLAYRGPVYRQMLDQITEQVRKYPCDYLCIDAESWEPRTMNNAMHCPRCNELRKKMKMNWVEYFSWAQAEYLKPFKAAVSNGAKAAGRTPPKIGYYALSPGSTAFRYSCKEGPVDFLGGFSRMFPKYTDMALYCHYGRDTAPIHHNVREVYKTLKNPEICIPFISGGTGAYFSEPLSKRTAHHFLEAVLNGSGGVLVFTFRSFESPLDYYYFARAVKQIAPFEDLLMEGSLDFDFSGSNKNLLYTKRDWKGKSLILIGNYEARNPVETTLPLKGKVTDLISGKTFSANGSIHVKIPADDYLLLLAE